MTPSRRAAETASKASDLALSDLIDRLRDDASWLASGHVPKSPDHAQSIGVELCELLRRVDQIVADIPELSAMGWVIPGETQ